MVLHKKRRVGLEVVSNGETRCVRLCGARGGELVGQNRENPGEVDFGGEGA